MFAANAPGPPSEAFTLFNPNYLSSFFVLFYFGKIFVFHFMEFFKGE